MVSHMKATVDIADTVLREAKLIAAREGVTLRSLVEEGLRRVVEDRTEATPFELRDLRYGEGGGVPGIDINDWMSMKHTTRGAGG
jgi:antitoxin component of RelBE/YafQ-DinJ toxin-antitoxin module